MPSFAPRLLDRSAYLRERVHPSPPGLVVGVLAAERHDPGELRPDEYLLVLLAVHDFARHRAGGEGLLDLLQHGHDALHGSTRGGLWCGQYSHCGRLVTYDALVRQALPHTLHSTSE